MTRKIGAEDPQLVDLPGRHVGAKLADPPRAGEHAGGPVVQLGRVERGAGPERTRVSAAGERAEVEQAASR
jgi:hypothetical protein